MGLLSLLSYSFLLLTYLYEVKPWRISGFHRIYSYITERASIIPGKGCWKAIKRIIVEGKNGMKKKRFLSLHIQML